MLKSDLSFLSVSGDNMKSRFTKSTTFEISGIKDSVIGSELLRDTEEYGREYRFTLEIDNLQNWEINL